MTNFTVRAYRGDQDLSAMLALIRTRPTAHLLDFPSLYGINQEENTLAGIQRGYTDPVATHPDYHRRGLARALLLTGRQVLKARGMIEAVLSTNSRNSAMQATAQAVGYRITGKRLFFQKHL